MKKYLLFILFLIPFTISAQVNLSNGLVGLYEFSGNTQDGSSEANHGTGSNITLTTDRLGNTNSAYSFNGTSSYISIPNTDVQNNYYTYSIWLKINTQPTSGTQASFLSIGNGYDQSVTTGNNYGGSTGLGMGSYAVGGGQSTFATGSLPTTGIWYHVVVTRDASNLNLYINGVLAGSDDASGMTASYTTGGSVTAVIGRRYNATQHFNGVLDDIRIYNRALNDCEIQTLYAGTAPSSDLTSDLKGHYVFAGNSNDVSSSGNHGTNYNVTLTDDRFGNPNHAYSFDGSSSYIDLPTTNFQSNYYTYSMWVKINSQPTSGTQASFISIGNGYDQSVTNGNNYGGSTGLGMGSYAVGGGQSTFATGTLPSTGIWYHIVVTRDANDLSLYINGVLAGSDDATSMTASYSSGSAAIAVLGKRYNSTQFFNGALDDVRIYDRALSSCEVLTLYNQELTTPVTSIFSPSNYQQEVNISPNPVQFETTINIGNNREIDSWTLTNAQGILVQQQSGIRKRSFIIDLSSLTPGIYHLIIMDPSGAMYTQKIVKE